MYLLFLKLAFGETVLEIPIIQFYMTEIKYHSFFLMCVWWSIFLEVTKDKIHLLCPFISHLLGLTVLSAVHQRCSTLVIQLRYTYRSL